ncbi:MAG: hypothetical protein Q8O72_10835 [Bacteroidales bacterium]|nr:hypothetical protein [Bacteroidales bacterium]
MEKIKSYFMELTIVTAGVLIALFLSNLTESNQERKYHIASVKTINNEVEANYSGLKGVIEKQNNLLDTLTKYRDAPTSLVDLFQKSSGLQFATLSNAGLGFYERNQINSIDFEMMSTLIQMNILSGVVDTKLEKLAEFTYSNTLGNSKEIKTVVILHLQNVLNTEYQLLELYKDFIDENIETEHNTKVKNYAP